MCWAEEVFGKDTRNAETIGSAFFLVPLNLLLYMQAYLCYNSGKAQVYNWEAEARGGEACRIY